MGLHRRIICNMKFSFSAQIVATSGVATVLSFCPNANAGDYTLSNGNSSVLIKANGSEKDPHAGMSGWCVDNVDQLYQQWFWYRIGNTGGEKTINQCTLVSAYQGSANTLSTVYQSANEFSIAINYTLLGGAIGTGSSTIGEQITINNLSANPLPFHLFQYVDFDLGGSNLGDTIQLSQNLSGLFDAAYQNKGTAFFADELVSPGANHGQAGIWPSIYNSLTDNSPTTLTDNPGPATGDASWAFQWDVNIPVGGSFSIALNKSVYLTLIPEPTSLALGMVGLAGLAIKRRRKI